jgi:hypothetical protein
VPQGERRTSQDATELTHNRSLVRVQPAPLSVLEAHDKSPTQAPFRRASISGAAASCSICAAGFSVPRVEPIGERVIHNEGMADTKGVAAGSAGPVSTGQTLLTNDQLPGTKRDGGVVDQTSGRGSVREAPGGESVDGAPEGEEALTVLFIRNRGQGLLSGCSPMRPRTEKRS